MLISNISNISNKTHKLNKIKSGFALPLALFSLIITSIIAVASVRLGLLDQDLARNQSQTTSAKIHAEFTINDAIDHILCKKNISGGLIAGYESFTATQAFSIANDTCINGLCGNFTDVNNPLWKDLDKKPSSSGWSASYGQYTGQNKIASSLGHYIIEAVQTNLYTGTGMVNNNSSGQEYQYRITAVGFGAVNSNISRTLQVLFRAKAQRCSYNPSETTKAAY